MVRAIPPKRPQLTTQYLPRTLTTYTYHVHVPRTLTTYTHCLGAATRPRRGRRGRRLRPVCLGVVPPHRLVVRRHRGLEPRASRQGPRRACYSHVLATEGSNPGLAGRVPGRSAALTCEPRLGQARWSARGRPTARRGPLRARWVVACRAECRGLDGGVACPHAEPRPALAA